MFEYFTWKNDAIKPIPNLKCLSTMKKLLRTFLCFGTFFVFSGIMISCTTYQHMQRSDDDIYYSSSDAQDIKTSDSYREYESYSQYKDVPVDNSKKDNKQLQKKQSDQSRAQEINRSVFRTIGYIMLESLYLLLIFD